MAVFDAFDDLLGPQFGSENAAIQGIDAGGYLSILSLAGE
ncbi:uncharacterized protein METZ01_LOCUS390824 [marine metagenome]|uniref:Uncharacterized protein n=1 Tax=marine metagenome TaxID=408172 RepID=A0A382UUT7_9ZZZZ